MISRIGLILLALLSLAPIAGCEGKAEPGAGFKPVMLPVKFTVGPNGIGIVGDSSIVTPIGEFSINARYQLPGTGSDSIYVIIRDRTRGRHGTDDIYEVRAARDTFTAVVDGRTVIQVQDGRVTIDVTDGTIKDIEFAQAEPIAAGAEQNVITSWWADGAERWNEGWNHPSTSRSC